MRISFSRLNKFAITRTAHAACHKDKQLSAEPNLPKQDFQRRLE
jgi:hypothetical protein